jgi:hypothetical protein
MTLGRIFLVVTLVLFGVIGATALIKKQKSPPQTALKPATQVFDREPIEIDLKTMAPKKEVAKNETQSGGFSKASFQEKNSANSLFSHIDIADEKTQKVQQKIEQVGYSNEPDLHEVNRVDLLFRKQSPLPICETVKYKARVSWKPGRSAWLVDYASHYKTPVDFIARSINGRTDYTVRTVNDGQEFSVLRKDKDFYFLLVVDLSHTKMWFYYVDPEEQEHFLLKTYRVGLGRVDDTRTSGSLTPLGTYKLGNRIAVFKPKMMGMHKNKRVELMRVFGTRWIPFEKEVENCTEAAKGYGIHGTPWDEDQTTHTLVNNPTSIGGYESDGCVRMRTEDVEELYAIITTRDTYVQIVKDVAFAKVPYKERVE